MKIRTPKDVEKLNIRIQEELGIQVEKYRNEEVVENFVELLVFPQYVITWIKTPILIAIVIFVIGFFLLDLVHIEYVIYALFGFILFLISGALVGLLFLIWKMKSDIFGIVNYSLDIMKSAISDLNKVNNQMTDDNKKDVLGLLFKGIVHIVTVPMISKVISDKVPFVGGVVNRVIKRILILVSDNLKFDEDNINYELNKAENEPSISQVYSNSITSVSNGLEKVMNFTFGIAQIPLKIVTAIILIILISFLYLIH